KYGPYAKNLNFVLQRLEGHYIRGYGDRSRKTEVHLLPEALNAAETFLEQDQDATQRLNRVSNLIEGFETPYGLELLGTVHWLSKENENVANNVDIAVKGVRDWNKRKKEQFKPLHIEVAWKRLQEQNWF
ncbi:MAG: Appr-1-p processing protein, partial [Candidatus Latescibacteria bacterium]|nr:Appr-1-p processing protein [Candidatus Latescibacterota bacterium]